MTTSEVLASLSRIVSLLQQAQVAEAREASDHFMESAKNLAVNTYSTIAKEQDE